MDVIGAENHIITVNDMTMVIHSENLQGVNIDAETRCGHYNSELDIIAIKFKCCGQWFPCFECHAAMTDHETQVWPLDERDELAILCGSCGQQLSINDYFACDSACPTCKSKFNPGCGNHYYLYFE